MQFRTLPLALLALPALLASADKKLPIEKTSNDFVEISGTLLDKDEIVKDFGSDLGGSVVVVRVTVRPLTDKASGDRLRRFHAALDERRRALGAL